MPNRLAASTSPFIRQHADDLVDWREWGEGAFAEARERDVPIFLSVSSASRDLARVRGIGPLHSLRRRF